MATVGGFVVIGYNRTTMWRHRSSYVGIRDPRNADDLEPCERTKELGRRVVYLPKKISLI
jgi:hypothetical protein